MYRVNVFILLGSIGLENEIVWMGNLELFCLYVLYGKKGYVLIVGF